MLFSELFVCICVLYYCHRVAIQFQLNISYHIIKNCIGLQNVLRHEVYIREIFSLLGAVPPSSYRQELRRIYVHVLCNKLHISVLEGFLMRTRHEHNI